MRNQSKLWALLVVAGLCVSAALWAEDEGPPPGREGERKPGPREKGDPRGGRPEGPPLLGDVKGVKEEIEKHRAKMREIHEQFRDALGGPPEKKTGEQKGDGTRKAANPAKAEALAGALLDEFSRHYQAMADLLKANREEAIQKLKEHILNPPRPPRPDRGPDARGGEKPEGGADVKRGPPPLGKDEG